MTAKQTNNDINIEILKELFQSNFNRLEDKIESNHILQREISENILSQATRTNGRVTKLEDKVQKIQELEASHFSTCPRVNDIKDVNTKIETINTELNDVRFVRKNPKTFAIGLSVLIIYILVSFSYAVYEVVNFVSSNHITTIK